MKHQVIVIIAFFVLALTSASVSSHTKLSKPVKPDNSRENALLLRTPTRTADNQPNDRADRVMAAHLRRVIMADDTLSTYGHNVKIIVANGKVTLEGPVCTNDERQEIAFDAASVAGAGAILNQITVT